jgi:hypothetical protein
MMSAAKKSLQRKIKELQLNGNQETASSLLQILQRAFG